LTRQFPWKEWIIPRILRMSPAKQDIAPISARYWLH
jgi:hypothetical protein